MKKKIVVVLAMLLLSVIGCNRKEDLIKDQVVNLESRIIYRYIPDKIIDDGDYFKVSFILSHQLFKIKKNAENSAYINQIEHAIAEKEPLRFLLRPQTNEIVKIENLTGSDTSYFNSFHPEKNPELSLPPLEIGVVVGNEALDQLFAKIKSESCSEDLTVTDTCITFRYPVDGCYARAHKMRKIIESNNYYCEKQFVYGHLRAKDEVKDCCVEWGYHVAVQIRYQDSTGGLIKKLIIDPSLFKDAPISAEMWRAACTASSCGTSYISSFSTVPGNVYYRNEAGDYYLFDEQYKNTNCVLETFKNLVGCYPSPAPDVSHCGF
ncbi:protein-glutamine glutaminase [Flavobacterium cerinum]|uniref:Protein-glutamine glutaminase n=1 Tax=Flavobacterium cerinum TaxID=2502784 RepID=A0ABY5IQR2_9FLAO|nr:protein-glutamine glutaminase [Flavobacterium cerinum]UUC44621.1 protein-glutamine glutaminase [Flavobacterium cerinum]